MLWNTEGLIYSVSNGTIEVKPRLKFELMLSLHVLRTAEDHHQLFIPWAQEIRQSLSEETLQQATSLADIYHESQLASILADYVGEDSIEGITAYIEADRGGKLKQVASWNRTALKKAFDIEPHEIDTFAADFFRRYYNEGFGKLWEQEHKKLVHSDAEKMAKELEKLDFSITEYMEQFTGRKFDNSSKIILYPSSFSRPQHAYGFTENGVKVFLYKIDKGIISVIGSGFHELLHRLIDGWEKPERIKRNINKLAKQELFEKTCQELKKSYGYPVGPLEEQLVHSMARYMLYKKGYIDEKQTRRGTYGPYEDALYDVLFDKYDSFDNVDDFIYYALSNIKVAGEGKEAHFEYIKQ
ncbi:MAG: hypothetical protein ACYSU4_09790 [Planctomycetota bacterium]|jgi:hypothetical protein